MQRRPRKILPILDHEAEFLQLETYLVEDFAPIDCGGFSIIIGNKVEIHSIRIFRIAEKKIIETWAMQDRLGLMEQLGLAQSAGGNVNWAAGNED